MKRLLVLTGIFALFLPVLSESAFAKSKENKAACERWCNENKPRCAFCDADAFCGGKHHEARKYDIIKSFKKGTGNWYACGLSEYGGESLKNKEECEAWCGNDERCKFCRDKVGCGSGHVSIKMFGGRGENWYGCSTRDILSQVRKKECETWCEPRRKDTLNPCVRCSSAVGCGRGYKVLKRFKGEGKNWNACTFIQSREECEEYCKGAKPRCEFCSNKKDCGKDGYVSMRTFYGFDNSLADQSLVSYYGTEFLNAFIENYYACRKK